MNFEVETFERQVADVKEKALQEIKQDVQDQKESIRFLISNANDAREKVEKQKLEIDTLVKRNLEDLSFKGKKLENEIGIADRKVMKLDEIAKKTAKAVSEAKELLEFTKTMASAQNNDRNAFDQLEKWSKDSFNPFSQQSKEAWKAIVDSYSGAQGAMESWNRSNKAKI